MIWRVFLGIDSYEFPARNSGDLGFRTWGVTARYVTNIMLLILGQVIQFGENISQVSEFKLCYVVCPVLFVCGAFTSKLLCTRSQCWDQPGARWIPPLLRQIQLVIYYPPIMHYTGLPQVA
jgi:hypothetical protein